MTNKKIKELYIKTLQTKYPKTWTYDFDEDYAEIFANLIIDECIELCLKQRNPPNLNYKPSESFAEAICSYFEHKMPIRERNKKTKSPSSVTRLICSTNEQKTLENE